MTDKNDSGRDQPAETDKAPNWREKLGLKPAAGSTARALLSGQRPPARREPPVTRGTTRAEPPVNEEEAAGRPVVRPAPLAPRRPPTVPGKPGAPDRAAAATERPPAGKAPARAGKNRPPPPPPPPPPLRPPFGAPGDATRRPPVAPPVGRGASATGTKSTPPPPPPPLRPTPAASDDDFARRLRAQREAAERLAAQRAARLRKETAVRSPSSIAGRPMPSPPTPPASRGTEAKPPVMRPGGSRRLPFSFADVEPAAREKGTGGEKGGPAGIGSSADEKAASGASATTSAETEASAGHEKVSTPDTRHTPADMESGKEPSARAPSSATASPVQPATPESHTPAADAPEPAAEASAEAGPYEGAEDFFEEEVPQEASRARPEDYSAALEELAEERPRRRGVGAILFVLALLLMVAVAVGVIYFYRVMNPGGGRANVPVIAPQNKPLKTKPAETPKTQAPATPKRRKKIYDRILGTGEEREQERITPSEEKPLTPPQAPAEGGKADGTEPLPLPLPPPPALDGGQGGIGTPPPLGEPGTRSAATEKTGGDKTAETIPPAPTMSEVPRTGETAALPEPPPLPEELGETAGSVAASPDAGAGEVDSKGLARLAEEAAGRPTASRAADRNAGMVEKGMDAAKAVKPSPTTGGPNARQVVMHQSRQGAAQKLASNAATAGTTDAGRAAGAPTAAVAKPQPKRPTAKARAKAKVQRKKRRTGGPRSILPPAVGGGQSVPAFAQQPRTNLRTAASSPVDARNAARPVKITNFGSAGQRRIANFNTGTAVRTASVPHAAAPAPATLPSTRPTPSTGRARAISGTRRVAAVPPRSTSATGRGGTGYVVQLASYRSREDALAAFRRLQSRHASLLGGMAPRIERRDLGDAGTFYRLAVGPLSSRGAARKLCNALIARGEKDCLVRRR